MSRIEYLILLSHFPIGSYIILDKASAGGIPYNSIGRIVSINRDFGTILVNFDNGIKSSLIYSEDMFHRYVKPYFTVGY